MLRNFPEDPDVLGCLKHCGSPTVPHGRCFLRKSGERAFTEGRCRGNLLNTHDPYFFVYYRIVFIGVVGCSDVFWMVVFV